MALGDGIRRNVATITQAERNRLRDAIIALHQRHYPGERRDTPTGGVSFWFKQDEIHQATHVHHGPEFLPWHRELCNRFEQLLREVDPQLSLHYWDWTTDPQPLFTNTFMGSANGQAGDPWLTAKFYVPNADPFRGDSAFDTAHSNPFDPPRNLTRAKQGGVPNLGVSDAQILAAATYPQMRLLFESAHDNSHGYIGGTIGDPHTSFRDPFVFLLHSNVDRLFAMWQTQAGQEWRLDPNLVYGTEGESLNVVLEPWAGQSGKATRPWAPPENQQLVKNYKHISVVTPPRYDTAPHPIPRSKPKSSSFAVSHSPGVVEVFWVRPDGLVFTNARDPNINNGNWNNPIPIAPNPGSADPRSGVAAVSHSPGVVEVFWVRPDGLVFTNARDPNINNGNWNNPIPIAPNPGSAALRDV